MCNKSINIGNKLKKFLVGDYVNVKFKKKQKLKKNSYYNKCMSRRGLTYYIRHNKLPENRAEFYIAQKVGSILEEPQQRGLAHFLGTHGLQRY